jgi:hypothetical protein
MHDEEPEYPEVYGLTYLERGWEALLKTDGYCGKIDEDPETAKYLLSRGWEKRK